MSKDQFWNIVLGLFAISGILCVALSIIFLGILGALLGLAGWLSLWVLIGGCYLIYIGITNK